MKDTYEFTEQELKELCWSMWNESNASYNPYYKEDRMEDNEDFEYWFQHHLQTLSYTIF